MQIKKIHLIKICIIGFLLTFSIIYLLEKYCEVEIIAISEIDQNYLEKNVIVEGYISKQILNNNILFATIKENDSNIDLILFNINNTLSKNKLYVVEGKVTSYNDRLEIIVNRIHS